MTFDSRQNCRMFMRIAVRSNIAVQATRGEAVGPAAGGESRSVNCPNKKCCKGACIV